MVLSPLADELIQPHLHREVYEAAPMDGPGGARPRKMLLTKKRDGHNAMASIIQSHLPEYLQFMELCMGRL